MEQKQDLRVAWFSPFPPQRCGIADFSLEMVTLLATRCDVDLFVDDIHPLALQTAPCSVFHHLRFYALQQRKAYTHHVFQLGNSEYHHYLVPYLLAFPGIVMLHEGTLHHARAHYYLSCRDYRGYKKELLLNRENPRVDTIFELVSHGLGDDRVYRLAPMRALFLRSASGAVVLQPELERRINKQHPGLPVCRLRSHFAPGLDDNGTPDSELRRELGLRPSDFLLGVFGGVSRYKRINQLLQVMRLGFAGPQRVCLLIVGRESENLKLAARLRREQIATVMFLGYQPEKRFIALMKLCDLVVNLRYPSFGEVSAVALKAMGLGRPVMVYDTAQLADIPDNCLLRLAPNRYEAPFLHQQIDFWRNRRQQLAQIGANARAFVGSRHNLADQVDTLLAFIRQIPSRQPLGRSPLAAMTGHLKRNLEDIINDQVRQKGLPQKDEAEIRAFWRSVAAL